MSIAEENLSPNADQIVKELRRLDLMEYAVELDVYGVTVVPPEKVGLSEAFIDRLRTAAIKTCERRCNVDLSGDYRTLTVDDPSLNTIGNHWHVLYEDDVFVEALMHPMGLALARYQLGMSCASTLSTYFVKPADCEGAMSLPLHVDYSSTPGTIVPQGCTVSILCTDYLDEADGPTIYVPGSHKFGRHPGEHEMTVETTTYPVMPLRAPAGSMVVWGGATWHGSMPRTKPGLRVNTTNLFGRRNAPRWHLYDEPGTEALLQKFPGLDKVLGKGQYGWPFPCKEEIPPYAYDYLKHMNDVNG